MGYGLRHRLLHEQYGDFDNVRALRACLAYYSTKTMAMTVFANSNAPDFASRATTPSAALWPQVISIPLGFSIVSFLGIIVSSSSQVIYGEAIWSPIDLLAKFLENNPSHATRFGVWFISAAFILAQVCSRRCRVIPPSPTDRITL